MECRCIPYSRVPKSTALFLDYLYHYDRVASFYNGSPFDLTSYKTLAGQLQGPVPFRRELGEIVTRQNEAFGCAEPTFANIRRLTEHGVFAVVTGQQVGLLSGPAFTLYKALTAIRLAQYLTGQGLPCVPVYWLATEDHDLEEVAQAAIFDGEYQRIPLGDSGERPAPRSSVGYVKLTAEINQALDRLEGLLPPGEPRVRLLEDLRACYQPGATWGQAFGRFMARLFSRWGVVLFDPLDEAIHRLSARVYEQAIVQAPELRDRLRERSQALIRAGYHAQVHVAEDSTLVFAARNGNRLSVHQREGEPNGKFFLDSTEKESLADLKAWLANSPLDFSPNVLLRPIAQDMLLPTLAIVAGAAEVAYLGQAQSIYSIFGRPMPIIFPRAGFTLVEGRVQRLLEKYRLSVEDVWKGEEHLSHRLATAAVAEEGAAGWSERFDRSEQEVVRLVEGLRQDIQALDPTLLDSLQHAQEKIKYQMQRLRGKVSRAAFERSELLARHEQTFRRFLLPEKDLQERQVSGVYFLGRAGYELLDRLLAQIQTHSSDHQVVGY